jgi:hypothetical protein
MIIFRNASAIILGFLLGGLANSGILSLGPHVIPLPAGVDTSDPAKMAASIQLWEPKHFLFPFLAHALGTLVGAMLAFLIAASHQALFARIIGALFLAGGIVASRMYPAPTWFMVLDLAVAYLPMAWAGAWIGRRVRQEPSPAA